jgi:hypothetical protein
MALNVIGGKNGAVDAVNTVGMWTVTYEGNPFEYHASNTAGASGQLCGNKDWSGSYEMLGTAPITAHMPGASFTFIGSVDGNSASAADKGCTGTARVDSIVVTAPIAAGGPVTTTVNFSANGALTVGTAIAVDTTVPQPPEAKLAFLDIGGATVDGVQSITMTITADNKPYVSGGETLRIEGNFTVTLSYDVLEGDYATLPAPGDELIVKFYVTASLFWHLKWMHVENLTDLKADIASNEIVGATVNTKFNGFVSGVVGWIDTPTPSDWWGTVI